MSAWDDILLGIELYEHGDFREALEVYERAAGRGGDRTFFQVSRCYVLAELPDGPPRALAVLRGLQAPLPYAIYIQTVLQLLGRKAEAIAASRTLREQVVRQNLTRIEWVERLLEYNAGLIAASDLLAATGPSRLNRSEAQFFIGLTLLADGDRAGARDHFRQAVATRVFLFADYQWSRAFLSRLEKDPTWPWWIPVK
jgi:hypothetical protein